MNSATLVGFLDEMVKIAFGPRQANKVLSLVKKVQLPKASGRVVPSLSGSPQASKMLQSIGRSVRPYGELAPALTELGKKHLTSVPGYNMISKTKAVFPGNTGHLGKSMEKSDYGQALKHVVGPAPRVPPSQQKMLHAILKGHELDETSVQSRVGAAQFGHRSPDVIFREHNRLATLPKGNEGVVAMMKHFRDPREGAQLFPKGIEYGSGPRLSRHARKRLSELAERKAVEQSKPALKQALEAQQ